MLGWTTGQRKELTVVHNLKQTSKDVGSSATTNNFIKNIIEGKSGRGKPRRHVVPGSQLREENREEE